MKLKQIVSLAALMVVAAGVCNAQTIGTTTFYSKINVALVVESQSTNSPDSKFTITKTKITNKQVLELLSLVAGQPSWTNSATRAQLEYDWSTDEEIVADKTGTNILAYIGRDGNTNSYLNLDFDYQDGPKVGKQTDSGISFTEYNVGELELFNSTFDIDIKSYGPSTEKFTQNSSKWSRSDNFTVGGYWNSQLFGVAIISGKITANGKGKGIFPAPPQG